MRTPNGSHQHEGTHHAADGVHAERVDSVARVGLLVQAEFVLEENADIAQRGAKETHHEGTGVIDEARRRSDDDKASYSSRGDACGEKEARTRIQQSISTMLRASNTAMTNASKGKVITYD